MLQLTNLSVKGRTIVENYLSNSISVLSENKENLVASLYAIMEDANSDVIDILKSYIIDLNSIFSESDYIILQKECTEVIKYCFEKKELDLTYVRKNDNHPREIPESLLDLIGKLLVLNSESEIFLPYASMAQFSYKYPDCKYDGFEPTPETWAFSYIYLHCYGIKAELKRTGDLHDVLSKGKQYDCIFSFPPFWGGQKAEKVVDDLCYLANQSLKENGTMCCILPLSFCTGSGTWSYFRNLLFDSSFRNRLFAYHPAFFSATVIALPRNLYPSVSVDICLFILKNDNKGEILLVDATSDTFCVRHDACGTKEFVLKPLDVIETITNNDERFVWKGLSTDLVGKSNLLPSRYLMDQHLPQPKKNEKLMSLRELVEIISIGQNDCSKNYPVIGTKELSSNYLNCDIKSTSLLHKPNRGCGVLKENCLLAAHIFDEFMVGRTVDLSPENGIGLRKSIIPFRLKSNAVSEDFLLRSIMSDFVAIQSDVLSTDDSFKKIEPQDFLDIRIIVPSREEQDRLCKADARQRITAAEDKQKKADDDFRQDIHMKKHAIGQTIFNLNNWWKTLQRARKEGNGIVDDNSVVGKNQKILVKDIYDNIQQVIEQLQQQISKFDRGNGLVTEEIPLTRFIEEYIAKHQSPIFHFEYDKSCHHHIVNFLDVEEIYDENGELLDLKGGHECDNIFEIAEFAPEALTIVFDNIVSNACSHGFVGREDSPSENIIRIELSTEGMDHVITISNNGNPVCEGVTEEYVFTYSKSTKNDKNHYGIGGYEIKHLMREFDGDVEFISSPGKDFPVKYKLIFHNTNILRVL